MSQRVHFSACLFWGLLGSLVALLPAHVARAQERPTPVVWYRASPGCPDGAAFLDKLAQKARSARLATGGEHIDFVLTLLQNDGETIGRLERQTQGGTVAIRQLKDASCERVANALVLSLALALEPTSAASGAASAEPTNAASAEPPALPEPGAPAPAESAPANAAPKPPAPPPATASPPATQSPDANGASDAAEATDRVEPPARWLGVQGGAELGIMPDPLPRALAFLELERAFGAALPDFALRFSALGMLGSSATLVGPVQRWLLAGRVDACPWRFGAERLFVTPCAGIEAGATGASDSRATSRSDVESWFAPSLAVRGTFGLGARGRLELEAGSSLPLVRSDIYAGPVRVYQEKPLTFQLSAGVALGL